MLLPPTKGEGWGNRVSYTVCRDTYTSFPLQSSGLETESDLTVADSLVQTSAPCCCRDIEHWAGARHCALPDRHGKSMSSQKVKRPCGGQLTLSGLKFSFPQQKGSLWTSGPRRKMNTSRVAKERRKEGSRGRSVFQGIVQRRGP